MFAENIGCVTHQCLCVVVRRRFTSVGKLARKMAEIVKIDDQSLTLQNGFYKGPKWSMCVLKATSILKSDGVIAVPTDTIYGIAALAQSTKAINAIYDIKCRDEKKPIAICVGEVDEVCRWGHVTVSSGMLNELLPGPVTLVFERTPELNAALNPGTSLVGIRIPNHRFVRDLCRSCKEPLALTSANVSAAQSTLSVDEFKNLWSKLDLICDGGVLGHSIESRQGSTVVNLSKPGVFTVIRPGSAYEKTVQILTKYSWKEEKNS